MRGLFGSYECKIDAKGRLMLPAGLKKALEPVLKQGFILKKSPFHKCLELYPAANWEAEIKTAQHLNQFTKETHDFLRKYTAGFRTIELDAIGRLLVPRELIVFAGIKKNIVVTGYANKVEIWDKAKYEKIVEDTTSDYPALVEKAFGLAKKESS